MSERKYGTKLDEAVKVFRETKPQFVKGSKEQTKKTVIKNVTEKIDKYGKQEILSGDAWKAKIASKLKNKVPKKVQVANTLKKLMKSKTVLKSVPLIGPAIGVGMALATGDVNAAMPSGFEVEGLGPKFGTPEAIIENPDATIEQKRAAIRRLQQKK